MHPAPLSIFIIGDDATTNLMSGFILRRHFGNPDIHFFSNPEVALQSVQRSGITAPPTLIFLHTETRGMTWTTFLNHFWELPESVQNQYQLFLPACQSEMTNSLHHLKFKIVPWPLTHTFMRSGTPKIGFIFRWQTPQINSLS